MGAQSFLRSYQIWLDENPKAELTERAYLWNISQLGPWLEGRGIDLRSAEISDMKAFIRFRNWGNSQSRVLCAALVPYVRSKYGENHPLSSWKVLHKKTAPQRTMKKSEWDKLWASLQPGISETKKEADRRFWICDTRHPMGIRTRAILCMLIDTGFRSREICRLSLDHMDLIEQKFVALCKGGEYNYRHYTKQVQPFLFEWLQVRERFANKHSKNALFIGVQGQHAGKPLTHNGLRVMLRKLGQVTGVPALSPHVFRRSKITMMLTEAKAPSRLVQVDMDHKHISQTETYSGSIEKELARDFLPGTFLFPSEPPGTHPAIDVVSQRAAQ